MPKARVLVVDDAVVIRKIVTDALSKDPQIEVVGVAANGKIALQKIPQCNPDIITLDVEMPEMDGITTCKEIRLIYPKLPIIMFSTLTERGAGKTLEALSAGATDYVTKPANVGGVTASKEKVEQELIAKIKMLTGSALLEGNAGRSLGVTALAKTEVQKSDRPEPKRNLSRPQLVGHAAPISIIALGVSTGGPNALAEVLPCLPQDLSVPVVLVQHMPPLFTKMLAERLDSKCALKVVEAVDGMKVVKGQVYIAPGDYHMELSRVDGEVLIRLNQNPPENSCRPAVDPLFRSVVKLYGSGVLGVILTGMGQDGLRGCELIREASGTILAQDKASSVVWGMPGYVVEADLADSVLPLDQIGPEIVRLAQRGGVRLSH